MIPIILSEQCYLTHVKLAARRNGALAATKRITHRAIRMAIETGAVTSVAVTIELALILNASTTSWYFML
jgi:predicted aspartyl protease